MARTIGRRWPATAPRGDYQSQCDYCGHVFRRSELERDGAGKLVCESDRGLDALTLDRMNAEMTPPLRHYEQDSKSETKVTETPIPLANKIGGVTFSS